MESKTRFDLAIPDLDEAIRLNPAHVDAYRARGDCHRYREECDRAIADYEAALRLNPKDSLSCRGRGAAYRAKGELDRAIADYDTALQLNPKDFIRLSVPRGRPILPRVIMTGQSLISTSH